MLYRQHILKHQKTSETQRFITRTLIGCVGFRSTDFQERGIENRHSQYKR